MAGDRLVDLSLDLHTSILEKEPSLSILSIESSSRSEGIGGQQTLPEARTFEHSVFNDSYIMHILKTP